MKKALLALCAAAMLLTGCSSPSKITELTDWQFRYYESWHPATVPGCIHTDLMAHGLIPDPFYGTNEDSVQWVGDSVWRYRTVITRVMWDGYEHCELVLDGVTPCAIYLSGEKPGGSYTRRVGGCDNAFRQYRFELFSDDRPVGDSNVITVEFYPVEANNERHFSHDVEDAPDMPYDLPDHRVMQRTPPYMLGWDWGPKLSTIGFLQGVRLECYNGERPQPKRPKVRSWNVELRREADSVGESFVFYRDGKPLFCKGANWIPCHSFPVLTPALKERYRYLLTSAREANFNMLRVWGGGIYEPDYFFDLCDSLGLMVWVDFNFSCALYPSDTAFLSNVAEEARQQVGRIARHPCVVVWCGNNEVKNGWEDWGWQQQYGWTPAQQDELRHGIDTLFGPRGILARAVEAADPLRRPYIPSSPLYGWGHPECVTHGDSHYWGVWWGEEPFEKYAEKCGRFMSEFGFQSYPDYSTVCRFCPEGQRTIDSPVMRSHQKHGRGREIIDKAMRQYYGCDSRSLTLEDYCYVSQLLQAWGTGYGILQHLLARPHCMGTLYWQLDDCWPVASWSSIDCYGNWKALHYRAKALYAEDANLQLFEQYYKTYPKDLKLPVPRYSLTQAVDPQGRLQATVEAHSLLRDVMLQTEPHVDGHFDINYFDLGKGGTLTATFLPLNPKADMAGVKVTVKTLNEILGKGQK